MQIAVNNSSRTGTERGGSGITYMMTEDSQVQFWYSKYNVDSVQKPLPYIFHHVIHYSITVYTIFEQGTFSLHHPSYTSMSNVIQILSLAIPIFLTYYPYGDGL